MYDIFNVQTKYIKIKDKILIVYCIVYLLINIYDHNSSKGDEKFIHKAKNNFLFYKQNRVFAF